METKPASFNEFIKKNELPVFVDFWAAWCGPCKMIAPAVEQLAKEFKGKLTVVKVNVDEKPHLARQYGVQGIPALMIFKDGKIAWRSAGALSYDALKREVEKVL
ncbi:MAG TPA: thioredoxin [Patescibacteria group bacterium]|nr:thioredoxin [Patescibacteria group bacterium]